MKVFGVVRMSGNFIILLIAATTVVLSASAVASAKGEQAAAQAWFERMFSEKPGSEAGALSMSYEDVPEGITRGGSWRGGPYRIGEKSYSHGIAYNSVKHLLVRTGKPTQRFLADIGLENNDDTVRGEALGNGSVTFSVWASGKEVFKSPVMRRKDAAAHLDIPLQGATEFELRVGDAGDGRGWDQAIWAEAEVQLESGQRLRLQDMPWADSPAANPFVFSFQYQGTNSRALVGTWPVSVQWTNTPAGLMRTILHQEPGTGLQLRMEASRFKGFPAVEWVVYISNKGGTKSSVIENIQAFDGALPAASGFPSQLHWAKGAVASFDDFAPERMEVRRGAKLRLQPGGGRSSSQVLPFFNLEGANAGVIVAIGWTGEWLADFDCDARGQVLMRAGMEKTRISLEPGETIRTPRMLMLFYQGDRWRGQNLLRQFILAHHRPSVRGRPLVAPITCGNWGATKAAVHLDNIERIIEKNLPIDYYWIDAAWFGQGDWYPNAGNWSINRTIYPESMKPLSEKLRANKRELMLWFEPERVFRGTEWHREHPEFLIGPIGDNLLFNLGNPQALKFVTDYISDRIREFGLGCYRQDFNFDPLPFWRSADAADRQGITEIRYIEGLYKFWDELLARNPGLIIDNCASGGRRLDLETLGRATPFWRTDGPRDAVAHQCHTFGLLPWVPLSSTSQDRPGDNYEFRSSMCSALCLNWWVSGDAPAGNIADRFPFGWAKATLEQYLKIREFYYGDFYPLTSYSKAADAWMGYQMDLPEKGRGLLVVLRRPDSPYESARFPLRGIDGAASYSLRDMDTNREQNLSGGELLNKGLTLTIREKPGSALVFYRKL